MDNETKPEINEMSPEFMPEGETLGDRLIASSMFLDLAMGVITRCPLYARGEDQDLDYSLDNLLKTKTDILQRLKKYPAGSMQQ